MSEKIDDKNSIFYNPEKWETWESKLVIGSILIAIIGLIVLALLINYFILK